MPLPVFTSALQLLKLPLVAFNPSPTLLVAAQFVMITLVSAMIPEPVLELALQPSISELMPTFIPAVEQVAQVS
jgi:hypothetical protein